MHSLEIARRADVRLGQLLLLRLAALLLPLGEGGVHNVVDLRVVVVTLNTVDLRVSDVDSGHGQRRAFTMTESIKIRLHIIQNKLWIVYGDYL